MERTRISSTTIPRLAGDASLAGYCAGRFTYHSEARWQEEIRAGRVFLNGAAVCDPAAALRAGDVLAYDGSAIVEPEVDRNVRVLRRDDWFVAVDKPGNLPVHPSGRYFNNTLVFLLQDLLGRKVYPVHRLDRETSGVMLLAFEPGRVRALAEALAQGAKSYLALVHGNFPAGEQVADLPLGPDAGSAVKKKRRAWEGGSERARTRFVRVLARGDLSLVRCLPETGRLHQIRAHLLALGYPVVGDKLYGRDEGAFVAFIEKRLTPEMEARLILPRTALHSARLAFVHPGTGEEVLIGAPLPSLLARCIRSRKGGT
jgi:23S rRNA pseudouridine955/2504/2580 synthase/23S rRNA pseudouridine1911/1915/1917 synthase